MFSLVTSGASRLLGRGVSIDELDDAKFDGVGDPKLLQYIKDRQKGRITLELDADGKPIEGRYFIKWNIDTNIEPDARLYQLIEINDRPTFRREIEGHVEFCDTPQLNAVNLDDFPNVRDAHGLALSYELGYGTPVCQRQENYVD